MGATPYREIPSKLEAREAFVGSSMSATKSRRANGQHVYEVWSYSTRMVKLVEDPLTGTMELVYLDNGYYSQTTSRQQSIIRGWLKLHGSLPRKVYDCRRCADCHDERTMCSDATGECDRFMSIVTIGTASNDYARAMRVCG